MQAPKPIIGLIRKRRSAELKAQAADQESDERDIEKRFIAGGLNVPGQMWFAPVQMLAPFLHSDSAPARFSATPLPAFAVTSDTAWALSSGRDGAPLARV